MDNRSALLAHALRLFAARGYDGVGVQEIVDVAGVTKPTLYHYFGSKRGLLEALLDERAAPLQAAIREAVVYPADVTLTLRNVVRAYLTYGRAEPTFFRLLWSMRFAPPDSEPYRAAVKLHQEQLELLQQLFHQAAEHHGNLAGRERAYAITLLATIHAYQEATALDGPQPGRVKALDEALVYQVVQQFMYGIFS
jgi:TetR/AcrR family transcriptional regulator